MVTPFSTLAPLAGTNIPSFTFATSSEHNGGGVNDYGKLPVKLYNSSNVLIHQVDNGGDNSGKLPSGGVLYSSPIASSMSVVIANPITFYGSLNTAVISQSGQSSDLYNYYWTSYSRGTDGAGAAGVNDPNRHNDYLDSYIPLRRKSIYDPCPYGYRTPSNGTYNEFTNTGWTIHSYTGGTELNRSWHPSSGYKFPLFSFGGNLIVYHTSSTSSEKWNYSLEFLASRSYAVVSRSDLAKYRGHSLRCIEDCSVVSDATEASAGY